MSRVSFSLIWYSKLYHSSHHVYSSSPCPSENHITSNCTEKWRPPYAKALEVFHWTFRNMYMTSQAPPSTGTSLERAVHMPVLHFFTFCSFALWPNIPKTEIFTTTLLHLLPHTPSQATSSFWFTISVNGVRIHPLVQARKLSVLLITTLSPSLTSNQLVTCVNFLSHLWKSAAQLQVYSTLTSLPITFCRASQIMSLLLVLHGSIRHLFWFRVTFPMCKSDHGVIYSRLPYHGIDSLI